MTYRVLLFADHKRRDLLSLSALKVELERQLPDSLVLVASYDLWSQALLFRPHVVVLNHLHGKRNAHHIADHIRRNGGLVAVLPTEGRPSSEGQITWATKGFDASLSDLYCAWTQTIADLIPTEANPIVTGCPRMDIWFPPYNALIGDRETVAGLRGIDPDRETVTVIPSFPQAKFAYHASEFHSNDWKDLDVTTIKGREDPIAFAKKEWKAEKEFADMLLAYKLHFPDKQYIVSPHPASDVVPWRKFCEEHGLHLWTNNDIFSLLAVSDLHIGRPGCVTLQEAWIEGIPTLAFATSNDEFTGAVKEASEITPMARSVSDIMSLNFSDWLGDWVLYVDKWIGPIPGSTEKVATAIKDILCAKNPEVKEPTLEEWGNLHLALQQHSELHRTPQVDQYQQAGKSISLEMVQDTCARIRSIL